MTPSLLLAVAGLSFPAPQCRCPELALERYFAAAEIVVAGRVRAVREENGRREVQIVPVFRPGAFKGSLAGVRLVTPVGSASCGVEVAVDRVVLIFASRGDPADPRLAWFDRCSGSRLYAGGPDADLTSPFPDVPANQVIVRLSELADGAPAAAPGGAEFHTSPACWSQPRIVHAGAPDRQLRDRIRIVRDATPLTDSGGIYSPNGAYRVWSPPPGPATTPGAPAFLIVDDERPRPLRIRIDSAAAPPSFRWINEKLLFLRVVWGRISFTDLIVDVELGRPIYEEAARSGEPAFTQFQAACLGQCPCLAVPGSADSLPVAPRHQPLPGEQEALGLLQPGNLAYLDQDWDGRVHTEAGGRRFTVSSLKGGLGREEYPVLVGPIVEVNGAYWIEVSLYRTSPCTDPDAAPVHRGWVPAFSARGRLVAGTWSGGC